MPAASVTIGMRLDKATLARLDAYVAQLRRDTGLGVTRAAAARRLFLLGLEQTTTGRGRLKR